LDIVDIIVNVYFVIAAVTFSCPGLVVQAAPSLPGPHQEVLQQSDCPWEEICGPETGTVGLLHVWAKSLRVWPETPTVQLALSNSSAQKPLYAFETRLYKV